MGAATLELFLENHVFTEFDYAFVDPDRINSTAIKTYVNAGFQSFDDQISESVILMVKPRNDLSEIELLEKKLLVSATRQSINTLDELLADDFKEFGKSGLVYNKQDILSRLPIEAQRELGFSISEDGLYKPKSYISYCEGNDKISYVIKVYDEIAGFALINQKGLEKHTDWKIDQFFIFAKFQRSGVGKIAVKKSLAIAFW